MEGICKSFYPNIARIQTEALDFPQGHNLFSRAYALNVDSIYSNEDGISCQFLKNLRHG
jgi:hypothetical protein